MRRPVVPVEGEGTRLHRDAQLKSLREAPSTDGLIDAPPSVPASEMFSAGGVTGFTCFPPRSSRLAPETRTVASEARRVPARRAYSVQCYPEAEGPRTPRQIAVSVTHYPNEQWARYELRMVDGFHGLVQDRAGVTRAVKDGHPIYSGKNHTYWVSSDKLVMIRGAASPGVRDGLIDVYLKRYPNTLAIDFDLPYF